MRKNSLMVAAAVAALTIGSGIAMAQSPSQPAQSGSPAKSGAPAASGSMNSSGSVHSGSTGSGATTGAGASTEQKNIDEHPAPAKKGAANEKSEPKQKGATDDKSAPLQKGAQQDKAGPSKERMGQSGKPGGKSETTGQAPSERPGSMSKDKDNDQMKSGSGRTDSGQMNKSGQDNMRNDTKAGSNSTTNVNVNLSTEQRTRIKEVIVKEHNAPRVANVDFSLSVGTHVPRNKVKFVAVPSTLIEIQPQWRGYEYFLVGDQIVIVNPRTLEIVAVIEA